jgi:DNA-binding MarR family transcriptional regulator
MSEYAVERARQIFQARQNGESRRARAQRLTKAEAEPGAAPDRDTETGQLIGALHLVHARLRQLDGWLRAEHQLNLTEMHVLSMIPAAPAARRTAGRSEAAARLAREVGLSPSGLTRLVDRLVARGLVTRASDAWDRRVTHLVLTERGRDVRDVVLPRAVERIRDSCRDEQLPLEHLRGLAETPADRPPRDRRS